MKEFNAATYFVDRHVVEGRGNNIAIECGSAKITYRDLSENVNRFGNALRTLAIGRGDRIVLLLPDGPEFFISFFAAIKIGAVPVPINTLLSSTEYEYVLNDSEARIVITTDGLVEKIKSIQGERLLHLRQIVIVDEALFSDLLKANSSELAPEPTSEDDVALWLYSSGSTGAPKACVHLQHDMMVAAKCYAQDVLAMTEQDKCFSVGKLFFAYGLGNSLFCPLSVGATTILMPGPPRPEAIFDTIERHRPTLFFSVPSNYVKLLDYAEGSQKAYDVSSIRIFTSAGEPLPLRIFDRFKKQFGGEILNSIGATELFIFTSNRPGANRPGSAGQLIPTYEAKIVDENEHIVPVGESGNLIIKSNTICAYYWKQPEKTKAAIEGDWFRTGDKCYQDADGYIWYVGRIDDMFKSNGAWVSPLEIEAVLMDHPAISEAAIVGKKDENELMKPMAYIVLREGFSGSPELLQELNAFIKDHLPGYKRPRWIEFVDQLPRTTTGKLQRFKLRETNVIQ